MQKIATALLAISVTCLATGCATGTDGVVPIGQDQYMIGGLGKFTEYSGSAVKARMFQDAAKYCAEKNRVMAPGDSTGKDSSLNTYASAEVQFRCLPK